MRVKLELDAGYAGAARPEGEHVVVGLTHRWAHGGRYTLVVQAIPKA